MKIYLIEAKLTRDTELWGKMDPYCELVYKEDGWRSATIDSAGFTP